VAAWGVGLVIGPALGGYLAQVIKLMLEIRFKLEIEKNRFWNPTAIKQKSFNLLLV